MKDENHLLKRIFLQREKDQTKNFSLFLCKRPFDHRKVFLKNSQFHLKGFHLKSTSSNSFNKVWWKNKNHTEIRNPSEAHLEPSQRSMTELFRVNAFQPLHTFVENLFFKCSTGLQIFNINKLYYVVF